MPNSEMVPENFQYLQTCPECNSPLRIEDTGSGKIIYAFNEDGTVSEVESYILDRDDRLEIYCVECGFVHVYPAKIHFNHRLGKHTLTGGMIYNRKDP